MVINWDNNNEKKKYTFGKSAYQQNLSSTKEEKPQKELTSRDLFASIYNAAQTDITYAQQGLDAMRRSQADNTNKALYNPYLYPTNSYIGDLNSYGIDTSRIDDNFYNSLNAYNSYYVPSDSTNKPTSPGKKATTEQKIAYASWQVGQKKEDTEKAKTEAKAIRDEINYLVNVSGRNMSDDEIVSKIEQEMEKKYPTQSKMKEYAQNGTSLPLNEAVDYCNTDYLYGAVWAARNGGGTGNYEIDMAMSALGEGNQWQEDPYARARLNKGNRNPEGNYDSNIEVNYNPNWIGSTMEEASMYFNRATFDQQFIDDNYTRIMEGTDETAQEYMEMVVAGETLTKEAEAQKVTLDAAIKKYWENHPDATAEDARKWLEKELNRTVKKNGKTEDKYSALLEIDKGLKKGEPAKLTRAVQYGKFDYMKQLDEYANSRGHVNNGGETTNAIVNPVAPEKEEPEQTPVQAETKPELAVPEEEQPETVAEQEEAAAELEETEPVEEQEETVSQEPEAEEPVAEEVAEEEIPPAPDWAVLSDTMLAIGAEMDKKITEAADLLQPIAGTTESMVLRDAGSSFFEHTVAVFGEMKSVQGYAKRAVASSVEPKTKLLLDNATSLVDPILTYESKAEQLPIDQARFDVLKAKYGDVAWYSVDGPEPEKQIDVGGVHVGFALEETEDAEGNPSYQYVLSNIWDDTSLNYALMGDEIFNGTGYDEELIITAANRFLMEANKNLNEEMKAQDLMENGTEGQKNEINEYRALNVNIQNAETYIADHKTEYEEQRAQFDSVNDQYGVLLQAMTWLGMDTTDLENSMNQIMLLSELSERPVYVIPNYTTLEQTRIFSELLGQPMTAEEEAEVIHGYLDECNEALKKLDDLQKWLDETGYTIPAEYRHNLMLEQKHVEFRKQGLEYDAIRAETDYDEFKKMADIGREFEEEHEIDQRGWNASWMDQYGDSTTPFSTLQYKDSYVATYGDYFTAEEEDMYYYLLGRAVSEHKDFDPNNKESVMSVLKDANDYYEYMTDGAYGIMTRRQSEANDNRARERANGSVGENVLSNLAATAITPIESLVNGMYAVEVGLLGEEFNQYNPARNASHYKNITREETRKRITDHFGEGTLGEWAANIGYEIYGFMGDSTMNAITFGMGTSALSTGSEILNEIFGASPMGITAAMQAFEEAYTNGAGYEQALAIAGITFLSETVSEGITLSNINNMFNASGELNTETLKGFIKDWLTQEGRDEAIGETLTEAIQRYGNIQIMGEENNMFKEQVDQYLIDHPNVSREDAIKEIRMQWLGDYIHTAFVSYISPGVNIVGKTAKVAAQTAGKYLSITKSEQQRGNATNVFKEYKRAKAEKKFGKAVSDALSQRISRLVAEEEAARDYTPFNLPETEDASEYKPVDYSGVESAADEMSSAAEAGRTQEIEKSPTYWADKISEEGIFANETETAEENAEERFGSRKREKRITEGAGIQSATESAAEEDAASRFNGKQRQKRYTEGNGIESTAPAEEASTAASGNEVAVAQDVAMIETSRESDSSTKTAAVASALTLEGTGEEGSEAAQAAATNLRTMMGENSLTTIQQMLIEAEKAGIPSETIKEALQFAGLGDGDAAYIVNTKGFQNATAAEKVQMLIEEYNKDKQSPSMQRTMARSVQDFMTAREIAKMAGEGHFDQAKAAQDAADAAHQETEAAQDKLDNQKDAEQAANDAAVAANEEAINNPTDENRKNAEQATNQLQHQADVTNSYQEGVDAAKQREDAAQEKADQAAQDALTDARGQGQQNVEQKNAERAEQKAQEEADRKAEEERRAAEQAEEDEKTGKAWEIKRDTIIEDLLNREHLEGEERETRRQELMKRADEIKLGKIDMTGLVNNTEGFLAVAAFGRKLGLTFKLTNELPESARGQYDKGVVYLNENLVRNGKMTIGQALVEASLHEITHSMEETKNYQTYKKTVLNYLFTGKNGEWIQAKYDAAIDQKIADYKKNLNKKLTPEEAEAEIVADFARTELNQKDVVQRFMDAGLGGKMRNTLHNINQTLKNFKLKGQERVKAEYLRRAERSFQKALNEVAKTDVHPEGGQFSVAQIAQATGMTFNEETLELRDQNGNVVDGVNNKITPDMINSTPVGMLIDQGLTGEQNQKAKDMMAGLMNMVARYRDSNLVWEIGATTLSSTFSALKSNSDPQYKTTVDFGTVCAKTQAIIDVMSQVMLDRVKEGKTGGLTREEIMKVYDATNQAGLSVPCPVCYVFSRWMGVPSLLGQMSQYQNDYVVQNEDGSINTAETQKKVDEYIRNAEKKYGDAKAINNAKTAYQNNLTKLEEQREQLKKQLRNKSLTEEERNDVNSKLKDVRAKMTDLESKIGEVSAYNWVTQALCKKDKNGKFVVDSKFKVTPDEILFDLNRTAEFAEYEKNWKYRNTRGAGMGKAIMPYSGETIGDILYGVKSGGRQSTLKNPWLNMDSKAAQRQLDLAKVRARKQNLVGGQRLQSTSDFRPEWGLDYIMSFLELQAAGSKTQMYTKVADAVDLFASVGADVNLSIMGKGQGWHVDENGNKVLDFSSVTGMDYDTAKALKDKYDNVQMILVGMNDTHIRLAMADSDIDFIIPWHSSGNSKDVLAGLLKSLKQKLDSSVDYTTTQTDMVKGTVKKYTDENGNKVEYTVPGQQTADEKALWDARVKLLTKGGDALTLEERTRLLSNPYTADLYNRFTKKGVDADCYGVKLSKEQANQIFPYEYWNTSLTKDQADENGKRFVEYCESMGIVPRFSQFKDDPGYWKLLIDRPMYNNDGTYHQQQVIDVTNAKIGALNDQGQLTDSDLPMDAQAKYAPNDPRNENYEKYTAAERDAVDLAKTLIDQQYDDGSEGQYSVYGDTTTADMEQMLSEAASDYQDAVKRGDMKAAQEDVDTYAQSRGYTEKAYHGTNGFGFTQFDLEGSQDALFVAYDQDLASTYTYGNDIREVSEGGIKNASPEELAEILNSQEDALYFLTRKKEGDPKTARIEYNPETGLIDVYELHFKGDFDTSGTFELAASVTPEEAAEAAQAQYEEILEEHYFPVGRAGIYELYTRPGNQLVVELDGEAWNQIPWYAVIDATEGEAMDWQEVPLGGHINTRRLADIAKRHGYDSVRINGVLDSGEYQSPTSGEPHDIGIFFKQDDLKSADTVTRDDKGNVIPLEQRFTENPDIRYSSGGKNSMADVEQIMREAGLDVSAEERSTRLIGQHRDALNAMSGWNDGSEKTLSEVQSMLGDNLFPALHQWLHNTYQKGMLNDQLITKDAIETFMKEDRNRIINGADSIVNGWSNLLKKHKQVRSAPIKGTETTPGKLGDKERSVYQALFGDQKQGYYVNKDTGASIRLDDKTVRKTFAYSKSHNVDADVTEKVLHHADTLLENALYIGSHQNYAHPNGNVHYFVSVVNDGTNNRSVLFAVHDAIDTAQQFDERAYVAEIRIIDEKQSAVNSLRTGDNQEQQALRRTALSTVSIGDVLSSVNPDRIRFFDKEALSGKQMDVSSDGSFSSGGEMTLADMDQELINSGILTEEEVAAYNAIPENQIPGGDNLPGEPGMGPQRQFGHQTAQNSDALHRDVQEYLYNHSTYDRDTNQAQIARAVDWVQSHANVNDETGFIGAMQEAMSGNFDFISADGQARMLTLMSIASLRGEQTGNHTEELALADLFNRQGTEVGRALQARKIFRLMTPVGRVAALRHMSDEINEEYARRGNNRRVGLSDWVLEAAAHAETEEDFERAQHAAAQELAEQMPANWREKLQAWRMLSMLGNVRTHVRNVLGNAAFMPVVGMKNKLGAAMEALFLDEGERTKTLGLANQEARNFARTDADEMENVLRGESRFNEGNAVQRERRMFGQGNGIISRTLGRGLQALIDVNSAALEAEDWIFLKRHYQNALAGYMTANGLTAADMTGDTLDRAREYAVHEAQKATYRDCNSIATWMNNVENPAARFLINAVLPFKKTPANILRRGVEYSPVNLLRSLTTDIRHLQQWNAYQNGELETLPDRAISPAQYIDRLASGLTGTAIMALGALLSKLGFVRAGFDDDDEFDKLNGSQEYSVEIGGVSYTVDWAAPVCMPFFTGATLMETIMKATQEKEKKDVSIAQVLDSILGITEPVFNLSMLEGVNNLFSTNSYSDAGNITQVGLNVLANYATSYVPTLSGQVARTIDTTRRKNYVESGASIWEKVFGGALEQVENKLPFLSRTNIPYRDVWGNADVSSQGWAAIENFISPGYGNELKNDPVNNELKRLYESTGNPSLVPKAASKNVSVKGKNEPLTAEQYDQYVVDRGQTAYNAIKSLMDSPIWQVCDDDTRTMMIADAWTYANQISKHNLNPNIKKDSWVANAEHNGTFVETVVDRAAEKNRKDYIAGYGQSLAEAIDSKDKETADMCLAALEHAEAKDSQIKSALRDYFKPLYQQAFEANDTETMEEIYWKLVDADYGFDDSDFESWLPSEEEEDESEEDKNRNKWLIR